LEGPVEDTYFPQPGDRLGASPELKQRGAFQRDNQKYLSMSDAIQHECGVAMIRLLKPLSHYKEKYDSPLWAFNKLFLLMEKQHNRGQDGAGIGCVKLNVQPGLPYMFRERSIKSNPLARVFRKSLGQYSDMVEKGVIDPEHVASVKHHFDFAGEVYMGHLRYGTSGGYSESSCHPFFRKNNWPTKNLMLAGNFNMTNTPELNERLIAMGQHPIFGTDTQTILEEIGFELDNEHDRLYRAYREIEGDKGIDIAHKISHHLDVAHIIESACRKWDGGYSICGFLGNGDAFMLRDPWGIRPLFYVQDEELIACASERAPLMTVFNKKLDQVREFPPGDILVIKADGRVIQRSVREPRPKSSCSFERIYFSRGNDVDIYRDRKLLGSKLAGPIEEIIGKDFENTVFSYIPNTAEIAYKGMIQELRLRRRLEVKREILERAKKGGITEAFLDEVILKNWPRSEKVANKDIKLRTFISQEVSRQELVSHVYDITYGTVEPKDTLVCVDDSIVRGTTLRKSVISILARLNPKKIVIVSTAPQIRYPDCYGIDMSQIEKFIAFEAATLLLREKGEEALLEEVYHDCKAQESLPSDMLSNKVAKLYDAFTVEQVSAKISQLVRPKVKGWDGELQIVYQTIDALREALPEHKGDWYFTGDYPTPGGYRVLNRAYINYYEKKTGRSY
jgi:amidophosphoribosyltransferase